ncbi:MAG: Potassium channel [Vezdaea aestivalis]|nr:MAG: Potassium channel [Vezdaea aestivalis]
MNDPGLEDSIANGAHEVEKEHGRGVEETHNTADMAYLAPSRWWFASTAFPLVAGTFGPMASAFSVCALVVNWRVEVPSGGTEIHGVKIADPKWLIAVNAISLLLALIANMALLLNMARRLSFPVAQPITIIGWYLSSILLIVLVSIASTTLRLPSPPDHAHSQAFYYAIIAASLYFIVASLMVVTVWGAHSGHYSRDFKLTMSQRTLMLQTIAFLVYLLGGAAIFARIENWNYLDGVYWADFTLLTIGIGGDLTPKTHLGRCLLFPFAVGGIVTLGLVVGSIRSLALERGKKKLGARMVEKRRYKTLKGMKAEDRREKLEPILDDADVCQSEIERREQEFLLMRRIQSEATNVRRWTSLAFSATIWITLWLVGAIAFWKSEKNQQWSYFSGIYFAYTSLLTIGYGDLILMSNSGKPFFVFWSLCAVPSLTILISHMGDTVVALIRDATIWLGNLTVLPGESGVMDTLKMGFNHVLKRRTGNKNLASQKSAMERQDSDNSEDDRLKASFDELLEDSTYRHYLLVKEIQTVISHLTQKPSREYSYEEWVWCLKLMGEDESNPGTHKTALIKAPSGSKTGKLQSATERNNEGRLKWSWLGHKSPLMGEQSESEWLLKRLTDSLERELKQNHDRRKSV